MSRIVEVPARAERKKQGRVFRANMDAFNRIVEAAHDNNRVAGHTHNFYRYPARFSPQFVRAAIETFTEPGDVVLDPFLGGGTTAVEALALGRNAIGVDISSLAIFVANVKTTILNDQELETLERWAIRTSSKLNLNSPSKRSSEYADAGYYRHLDSAMTWRLRKAVEQSLAYAVRLPSLRLEAFARCAVLKTAQWALDGRKQLPTVADFRSALKAHLEEMLVGAREFRDAVTQRGAPKPNAVLLHRSIVGIENDNCQSVIKAPKLVLTSPPYPGIHVLYHRWQIDGGKETPAPFWIANKLDGSGAAYYTFGDRKATENWTYFEGLKAAFESVARLCDEKTVCVQVLAFSKPERQLPRYLEVMSAASFEELPIPAVSGEKDGRLWRTIPNRKWHAHRLGKIPASQEVVLFHRKK